MHECYEQDAKMQENAHPPAVGLAAAIEREQGFMNQVMEWKGFAGTASGVRGRLEVEERQDRP